METMAKRTFIKTIAFIAIAITASAQRTYLSNSGELIFSFANYIVNGNSINTPPRFTMFFHASTNLHKDFSNNLGFYTGIGIRNVGFTSTQNNYTIKRRNYYVGIPLALKLGNLSKNKYLYAGAEGEIGFNYKEKHFNGDNKIDVFDEWFSARTPLFMPSLLAGINFKSGLNLRFKYYLLDFLKTDYTEQGKQIYAGTESKMFYFSILYNRVKKSERRNKRSTAVTPLSL